MKTQSKFVLLVVTTLLLVCSTSLAGTIKTDVVDPYVEVKTTHGTGAGVLIKVQDEVLVLTAGHVASDGVQTEKGGASVEPLRIVRHIKGKIETRLADVVYFKEPGVDRPDLGLLRPRDARDLPVAEIWPKLDLELGEDCWYIGTPGGIHARLERSIISILDVCLEKESEPRGGTHLATNGCGYYGSSGGPLFVKRKHGPKQYEREVYVLAGIIVCGGRDLGENPKCIGYAVDHKTIMKFLAGYKPAKKGGTEK